MPLSDRAGREPTPTRTALVWPETRLTSVENTRATALQQLRYLRELRAREIRVASDCPGDYLDAEADWASSPTALASSSGQEDTDQPWLQPERLDYSGPAACSYLQPGQGFEGTQRVARLHSSHRDEDWGVNVRIQELDLARGYVAGSMRAENVPQAKSPVVTFWEGEVVDNANHDFVTGKWGATRATDFKHWSMFEAFTPLKRRCLRAGGRYPDDMQRCPGLAEYPFIFMRWKERCFVNVGEDCGLTIAGFYYACLNRQTGAVEGFYFDPNSSPYQRLELAATRDGEHGRAVGAYEFR